MPLLAGDKPVVLVHLESARLAESVVIALLRLPASRASATYPLATASGKRTSIAMLADGRSAGGPRNRR